MTPARNLLVLGLLLAHESASTRWMYGMELVRASAGALSRDRIQKMLSGMEDEGLVQSAPEPEGTPRRRWFRSTALGRIWWSECRARNYKTSE